MKDTAAQLNAASAVTRRQGLEFANQLADSLAALDTYSGTPGLVAYARLELNNPTIDVVTEYTAMRTQIVATQDWLVANFPKDASNNLVVYAWNGGKRYADINLTAPQLSAFKTQLQALIATIS